MLVIFHEHRGKVRNNADPCDKSLFFDMYIVFNRKANKLD